MSTNTPAVVQGGAQQPLTTKSLFAQENVQQKFQKMLGAKTQGFISSVLQIVNGNKLLATADPMTVYNAAATAAILDLPINNNLGFSWIVPYKGQAQYQIGWKGLVQLALRTSQYLRINVIEVYQNQYKGFNSLTEELDADFSVDGVGEIVGYCSYFKLVNGFEKTTYWSKKKVTDHANKYSQAYKNEKAQSPWKDKDQFHEMAKKTVLKNTLSKWGILSIEMQKAVELDQAVIHNEEGTEFSYVDNEELPQVNKEHERIEYLIGDAKSEADLKKVEKDVPLELLDLFNSRVDELKGK